ncbi:hypothetical protein [Siphonobacter curvatus]|uniref:Uncharacterized protein n=1 Tax=Siphonobacter curvatus TaxID=2094562 RepID=A0A2S7IN47_9BACT|nr:hypothetical protein [Siphonobacter curvatus]PQA59147.1 hypothetical protein C5O19_05690 [Siphonobacter curvatus]
MKFLLFDAVDGTADKNPLHIELGSIASYQYLNGSQSTITLKGGNSFKVKASHTEITGKIMVALRTSVPETELRHF